MAFTLYSATIAAIILSLEHKTETGNCKCNLHILNLRDKIVKLTAFYNLHIVLTCKNKNITVKSSEFYNYVL